MSKFKTLRAVAVFFALVLALGATGWRALAQGTSGTLTGQVADPSGAAISGATITLTDVDKNFPQTVTTDSSGVYVFKLVPPGNYALTVVASGFTKYHQTGIVMTANTSATQNVGMQVGATTTTVSVSANAQLIDTTTPELGMTVNQAVGGRSAAERARSLHPGAAGAGHGRCRRRPASFGRSPDSLSPASLPPPPMAAASAALSTCSTASQTWIPTWAPTRPRPIRTPPRSFASSPTTSARCMDSRPAAWFRWPPGAARINGTAASLNSCATAIWTQGTGYNHAAGYLPAETNSAATSAGPPSRTSCSSSSTTREPSWSADPGSTTTKPPRLPQQMLSGDFSGLVDYAEAHNSACGSGYAGPRTLSPAAG